ncbi:MAG: hypothetical protein KBF57_10510 [Saprospiraceae bacterium]|nr:hypothetical protein [Saprospiraceae bacterium]MBP9195106.1 hypothetical protein [Saprospiraceae bacterium]
MKNLLTLFFFVSLLACGESIQKQAFLYKYTDFVEEVSKAGANYDEKKWDEMEQKFNDFKEVEYPKYKDKMTAEETQQYNELTGRYYGAVARHQASKLKKEFQGLLDQTQGVLDELKK